MKKRIIVVSHAMEIGGAERALLGLLNSIDFNKYEIDLFLARAEGELMSLIPKYVNLLPRNQAKYLAVPIKNLLRDGQFKMLYGRMKAKLLSKRCVKKLKLREDNQVELTYSHLYTYQYVDNINPNVVYDLAISFLTPHYICKNKINSKKYIAWIHTDYKAIDIDINTELDMWKKYDYIASISDNCTNSFLYRFPSLKNKIIRIDNIVTNHMIEEQSTQMDVSKEMKTNNVNLLSIGRFCTAKNFENIPEICKHILDLGLDIKWYIIGYGGTEQLIKDKIKEYNMQKHVFILGKKDNPYPYIKACDFYVQPSRYEGKAVTVREAQILCKPVIITNFPTSKSQLTDGVDGIIVSMDNEGCAKGIVNFINNTELQDKIIQYLKEHDYSNSKEVKKIYELIK